MSEQQPAPAVTVPTVAATTPPPSRGGPLAGPSDPQLLAADGEVWTCNCGQPGCFAA
jgi:hypothetical protein